MKRKMKRKTAADADNRIRNLYFGAAILTILCMALTIGLGGGLFRFYSGQIGREAAEDEVYDRYYVMITEDRKSSFWQSVYQGAYDRGLTDSVYVDWQGEKLSQGYDREDLMRIAIASDVDGIIVTADEGEEITGLIDEATAAGIPVVTLYGDSPQSSRCSFVGVGSYNIGREYGRIGLYLLADMIGNRGLYPDTDGSGRLQTGGRLGREGKVHVAVLMNAYANDLDQNLLFSGIQETMEEEKSTDVELVFEPISIDRTNDFSVEESIRDIFMEEDVPDIIVCLDELSTTCAYQAVVDRNMVGDVNILGYYLSDTIVNAIDRQVIYATVVVDTEQMGAYCIDALEEYYELGYTSQYFTADVTVIGKNDVDPYLQEEGTEDE